MNQNGHKAYANVHGYAFDSIQNLFDSNKIWFAAATELPGTDGGII